jgi:glutamine synthetase
MANSVAEIFEMIKENDVKMIDFRFTDLFGIWHHFSLSVKELDEDMFEEGIGFDGSSIRGFQTIDESDMILIPDVSTAFVDPIYQITSLVLICDVYDPITRQAYSRDPRGVAKKAEAYLKKTGIADTAFFGPEPEFFLFDSVRYGGGSNSSFYFIDSPEGWWNSGAELGRLGPNLGGQIPAKRGYFPVPPTDSLQDVRSEMVLLMEAIGIAIEVHHHEVGTAGQCEIDMKFDTLTKMATRCRLTNTLLRTWPASTVCQPPLCPSPSLRTTAPGCTPTRACGKVATR